ncbi:MAG: PAS domain S-box protein [Humidesulfovibrio sp.]|nr:PAS domain S-box protein [Humidesulfovibrio sp.]
MKPPAAASSNRPGKGLQRLRWEVWCLITLTIAAFGIISWLHLSHQERLHQATLRQDALRQTRIDLTNGLLAISLAGNAGSPFQREQGLAQIDQALGAFDSALAASGLEDEQVAAHIRDSVRTFKASLALLGDPRTTSPERVAALRIAYHDLESHTDTLDARARKYMVRLHETLTREYTLALALSALMLSGGGIMLLFAARVRENVEAQRKDLARRHEITLRSIGDGVIVTDDRGRVELLNFVAENMTGWTDAEARGKPLCEIFNIKDEQTRQSIDNPVVQVLREGAQVSLDDDILLEARDGEERPIADSAAPIRDDAGKVVGVVLVFRDQSKEKSFKQALKESEQHFRTLANNGQALIWTSGLDKLCDSFNEPWLRFTGRSLEQELGDGWTEGMHPSDMDRCMKIYAGAFDRRESFSMEYRLRHASGEYRWIVDQGTPRYDSDGSFAGYIGHCLDIHNLKMVEDRLRKLSRALEQSPTAIVITDLAGRIEYVNPAYGKITGYDAQDAVGTRVHFLDSEEFAPESSAGLWQDIINGQDWHGEFRNRRKNGQPYWEAAVITPLRNADGEITHVVAVKEDISERKAVLQALEASEERFRRIVETANEGIWILGPEDRTTYVNRTMATMLGYEMEEMLDKRMNDFMFPPDRRGHKVHMRTRHAGWAERYECRLRARNGAEVWTLMSASPISGPDGCFTGSFGMCADITESKRVQRILETRLELARVAQVGGTDAVLTAALDEAEAITLSSAGFFFMADEDGAPLPLYWSTSTRERCTTSGQGMSGWARAVRSNRPVLRNTPASLPQDLPEGHVPLTRELMVPVKERGRLVACMAVANKPFDYDERDIDTLTVLAGMAWEMVNRERAQDALVRSKELAEAAAKAKSEFLANMSHEIRTPLNGVLGMLQLLQHGTTPEEQQRFTDMALDAGRRLLDLLNDILDFSRLEAGSATLRHEPFQLREVCVAVANVLGFVSRGKGLSLFCDIVPSVPELLLGDEARLRQILFNLVGNSIKFTQKGTVHIGAQAMPNAARPNLVHLHLWVADTGIGIEDEKMSYLFERFTQSDSSFARRHEGTGLGLAIVKRIVDLMGGNICVESELGVGTTIHVSLPLTVAAQTSPTQPDRQAEDPAERDQGPQPSLHVLVVEDDEISQLSVKVMLKRLGHECVAVNNGRKAIEALKREAFDCVLMDVQMPELDGVEATRIIRAMPELGERARVRIIALTAHAMSGDRERFLRAGMDDHVAKPLQMAELQAALRRVRSGQAS